MLSWLFAGALAMLTLVLGIMQYGWIDEVSRAASERMRANLHTSILRVSRDFNSDITSACSALMPGSLETGEAARELQFAARYEQWRESSRYARLFQHVSLAVPENNKLKLRTLNPESGEFQTAEWPPTLLPLRDRLLARMSRTEDRAPGPVAEDSNNIIELPVFSRVPSSRPGETEWILLQVDLDYVKSSVLPDLLQRDLTGGTADYQAAVVMRDTPTDVIYHSGSDQAGAIVGNADASVRLFDMDREQVYRALSPRGAPTDNRRAWHGQGNRRLADPMMNADRGRWILSVRHRAGSVETVVARARTRNLITMIGLLCLIMASVGAIVRFTRRSQRLAELQMEFVAGVSHELRTPLTVMRTAGFNLQGKVAADPARVQRYGVLIQEESQKLTAIVEQVLRFANVKAGRVIGQQSSIAIQALIDEAIADHSSIVEMRVASELPEIQGDPTTLKLALQNLLNNAAKYGGGSWIGVTASLDSNREGRVVEIRVTDHGPGIAPAEIGKIFDPFFRGKRAISDQIHGTGLGLSLAKRIVEAHKGTLSVHSEEGKGTEFSVRIPAGVAA